MKKYIIGVMLVTVHGMWGANGQGSEELSFIARARALFKRDGVPQAPQQAATVARQAPQPATVAHQAQQPAAAARQAPQPAGGWQPVQRKSLKDLIEEARRQAAERSKPSKVPATLQELKAAVTPELVEEQIQRYYGRDYKLGPREVRDWMQKALGIIDGNKPYFEECLKKFSLEDVVTHLLMQTRGHYPK